MREALTADTLFNTVAMVKEDIPTPILVVEGDDDCFVLKRHKTEECFILPGSGGRGNVLKAATLANRRGIDGVIFLVDADYDRIADPNSQFPPNVVSTIAHDFFMDLIAADARIIDRVIETAMRGRSRNLNTSTPSASQVREEALALAACLAPLRVANDSDALNLNFKGFPFAALATTSPSNQEVASLVLSRSETEISVHDLVHRMEDVAPTLPLDSVLVVGDHDFFRALVSILRKYGVSRTSVESLFNSFIEAIRCSSLTATQFYREVVNWFRQRDFLPFACPTC